MSNIVKRKFKIEGMHCSSCSMLIDGELEELNGVKSSITSYAKQVCEIEIEEENVNVENITILIENLGYKVVPVN